MSILAARLHNIKPSPTMAVTAKANELIAAGRDVISLGPGEPDFDTPEHIRTACKAAIDAGKSRYVTPAGIAELREAIRAKFERDNGLTYGIDEITVGSGGKQLIYNTLAATLEEGDEVIIPAPYWVSYPDITHLYGGSPVVIHCSAETGFKLTPEQLRAAITCRTKWLFLNSPSNPTGACYTAKELKALAAVLQEPGHENVWVFSDDIYEHIVYDGTEFATMASAAPEMASRTLTLNGMSKAYCMTGWRLAYAAGPRELISALNKLQSQSMTSSTTFVQWAGIEALTGDHGFIGQHNEEFRSRRDLVVRKMNAIDGIECLCPAGAFYVFPSCAAMIGKQTPDGKTIETDEDFVTYLLEREGVACVHGAAFGLSPHFRISFATSLDTLEEACNRIRRACEDLI